LSSTSGDAAYQVPPKVIADLADAPRIPSTLIGPTGELVLLARTATHLAMVDLCRPELKLAGLRFDPVLRVQSRAAYYTSFSLQEIPGGKERKVKGLPRNPRLNFFEWSGNGRYLAFTHSALPGRRSLGEGLQLWVLDSQTMKARHLAGAQLNACYPSSVFSWLPDNETLVCRAVPLDLPLPPVAETLPQGPLVQENLGVKTPARTLEDLLKNPHDERLFEHYLRTELALLSLDGSVRRLPSPPEGHKLIVAVGPSPDGNYLLLESIHRPFSYALGAHSFPRCLEVIDLNGRGLLQVADLPLADQVPIDFDATPEGAREIGWRSDRPAELTWVEAMDGGDPRRAAEVRDRLVAIAAPFEGEPRVLMELSLRYRGTRWGDDELALVSEGWWKTRRVVTWRVDPSGRRAPEILFDRSSEDRYSDPGGPAMQILSTGHVAIRRSDDGKAIFLLGSGASPEGDRPFLDRLELDTRETTRLWRSESGTGGDSVFERVVRLLDGRGERWLSSREATSVTPNLFLRTAADGELQPVTRFTHPAPIMGTLKKELIRYTRADGVQLSATLFLPPDYEPSAGPLPVLMWAYPSEFKSAAAAGQVRESPYRFVQPWWGGPELFALRGFAVLDNPTFPIVGVGKEEPNDTYVEQLVSSARAAVQELIRRGVGDPNRCAIGGHSYGAFTTANLLAHSDLFRAGIARSGAYNRTLTPFGFQSEERSFWEARETYLAMSPFNYADRIKRPLLLVHGAEDNNSGTYPIQSERLYQAIKGLGGTARLVMLPRESHSYRARESIMHTLWEMDRWLETYVASPELGEDHGQEARD
jgi:dipeptidyl aminopeptidase/acylaminoacyl peptidase